MRRISRQMERVRMTNNWSISITYVVAGALGFEPRITGPKPVALPLGHAPIRSRLERPPPICARNSGGRCSQKYGELSPSYQHRVHRATHARTLLPCFLAASCRAVYIPRLFSQRSVAQPGSAPASGAGGREFKSPHSDHLVTRLVTRLARTMTRPNTKVREIEEIDRQPRQHDLPRFLASKARLR
jgi:hypothetical protein